MEICVEHIMVIVGIVFFIVYNVAMSVVARGVPESISATSYISKERFGTALPFSLLCLVSSACLFPMWISVTPENTGFLCFLSCAGMLFAGSTPFYKEKFEGTVHYTSGMVAFLCGIIWFFVTSSWLALLSVVLIGGIWTLFDRSKYTFIFEVVGYLAICLEVLMRDI